MTKAALKEADSQNNSRTKNTFDKFFEMNNFEIHPDADLLLEYIGKKADVELLRFTRKRPGRYRLSPNHRSRLQRAERNILAFCKETSSFSNEGEITIFSIRKGLSKLCPLWPIC